MDCLVYNKDEKNDEKWQGRNPKDAGKSNREIARLLGVSEATIRRRLKELK
ncbi:AsnC family protein [Lysinibacillus fusiformis]|uniref:AsnC family protein n=1 Tax=Lysinibacillus fusiformis TaxID=28031 RepID=UPI002E1F4977|nr:AsnC family protein [Lysinibacillus fusiformis]